MHRSTVAANSIDRPGVRRRRSLLPKAILLLFAVAGLLIFIGVVGDARRTRNAMHQAEIYAADYVERAAQTKVLPLNLEPDVPTALEPKLIDFEWLSLEQVKALRQTNDPVLVAWSVPVLRFFGRDGRAAIVFHTGKFDVKWMTVADFNQALAAQATLITRLARATP